MIETPYPPLVRRRQGRVLGGVGVGLAEHLSLPVPAVRLGLVLLTVVGGAGLLAYAAFWVLLPLAEAAPGTTVRSGTSTSGALLALVAGVAVVLLVLLGITDLALPLVVAGVGVVLVWRQADGHQRDRWRASALRPGLLSSLVGAGLVLAGIAGFLAARGELSQARDGLLATVLLLGGAVVLGLPYLSRVLRELGVERRGRIRAQERTALSAQVHDSVLQTLALIQRSADDPHEVGRLARVQERELRSWLYRPGRDAGLEAGLEQVAADVEVDHGVAVEVVLVGGDLPGDDRLTGLTAATREAVVNAAKHAGASVVRVFAEVEATQVTVFVRDTGRGFDPTKVPSDRYGLVESVVGRLHRLGGTATVRSAPGEGTDVALVLPRA